jgi:hypothetical protein
MTQKPIEPRPITKIHVVKRIQQPTEQQIQQVIEMYPTHLNTEIIEKVKVTEYFLKKIAKEHGLKKSPELVSQISNTAVANRVNSAIVRDEIRQQIYKEEREKIKAELYQEILKDNAKFDEDLKQYKRHEEDEQLKTWTRRRIDDLVGKAFRCMMKKGELQRKTVHLGFETITIMQVTPSSDPTTKEDVLALAQSIRV